MFLLAQDELDQKAAMGDGFDINLPVTLGCLWAIFTTDLVQDLEYQVRPYEVVPGAHRGGGEGVGGAPLPGLPQPAPDGPLQVGGAGTSPRGCFVKTMREIRKKSRDHRAWIGCARSPP